MEWGPAKNFSTPPFFDHKSATKLPPEHKKDLIDELSSLLRVLEEECSILGEDTIWMDGYFKVISGREISQI